MSLIMRHATYYRSVSVRAVVEPEEPEEEIPVPKPVPRPPAGRTPVARPATGKG